MKIITRKSDYAIKALCYINRNNNRIMNTNELSSKLNIPRYFLRSIFQALSKAGILNSFKGKNGGFKLALPATDIYLMDIINTFHGAINISSCFYNKKICSNLNNCLLRRIIKKLEILIIKEFKTINIETITKY